ncbi:LysR family transcriptional regulator [Sphingobium sp. DEHP117]|uniref:LysR family transcriptional regulator n=1 Tax=Sphingobium sp. DEHP117 TaxID=2993436 RepID=UPI0027D4A86D|nr:LysR substrate-binding domain-containing protein [Sphingobium sp. DEHP117]MDQ4419813.1 LysR family transcriptional regulator [Sphingobium sp. DEHP117]
MFDPDYELFLSIIDAGTISAAARARGLTTAAVSKRLARLEQRLSARLVNRTTRRLALTPAGQDLYETLLPLRSSLAAVEERISGRHELIRGDLRLTAPTSFGRMHLAPCLARFTEAHPDIALTIDLSDSFVDLLASPYDAAVRIAVDVGSGLVGHRLMGSRRVLCAAPAYLARQGAPQSLAELERHALLAAEGQLPWQLEGPDGHIVFQGRSAIQTNSSEAVRELTAGGCGIALRSLWDVADLLQSGDLVQVLPEYEGAREAAIYLVHAPMPQLPANIAALLGFLREHFTEE